MILNMIRSIQSLIRLTLTLITFALLGAALGFFGAVIIAHLGAGLLTLL